jgi:FxsC-like protein
VPEGRDVSPYGEDATEWNPYHSESRRPLSALAEELIRSLDYRITVSDFDLPDPGTDGLTAADAETDGSGRPPEPHPGILLLDRWALLDRDRRHRLKAFDSAAHPWVGAIVPWNRFDLQCRGDQGERLREEVEDTLPLLLERGRRAKCWTAVNGVPTLKAFQDVLPVVVAQATRQFLRHAKAHPPDGPVTPRPRLSLADPTDPDADSDHGGQE